MVRLIIAWLFSILLFRLIQGANFFKVDLAFQISIPCFALSVAGIFLFLMVLARCSFHKWVDAYGPLLGVTLYGFFTVSNGTDLPYILAICLFICIAVIYALGKTQSQIPFPGKQSVLILYLVGAIIFIAYVSLITSLKYLTYRSGTFDMGIWAQMFYSMKKTFLQTTTCERNMLLSHFAVHFTPIYYLYLPFYALFSSPITLQILQAVTIGSGFIPLYLLCRQFHLSNKATAMFGILFLLYPSLSCGCYFDLHENCFLVPLLLWLFYSIEKNSLKGILIVTLLLFCVKEDVPVYTATIGLYLLLGKKQYRNGFLLFLLSILAFAGMTLFLKSYGLGIQSYRYSNFMSDTSSGSLMDVIRAMVLNPSYFIKECISEEKIKFLFYMFIPLGCLPLMSKKVSRFLLLIPLLLVNLASTVDPQNSIFYQYTFGTLAILFYMAIANFGELTPRIKRFLGIAAVCSSLVFLPFASLSRLYYVEIYTREHEDFAALDAAIATIPEDASVMASPFLVAHMANRDTLYMYPDENYQPDYIMLDLRLNNVGESDITSLMKSGYKMVSTKDDVYLLLKK